jgi:hypothetical protein
MNEEEKHKNHDHKMSEEVSKESRISRRALLGVIILPFGFLLGLYLIPLSARITPAPPSTLQIIFGYTLLLLSIIAPIAATTLGFFGIAEIRNSNGKIYGMPLAVFVGLFYPVIFFTAILFVIGWIFLGNIQGWDFIPVVWFFLVLVIDYLIIKAVWNVATREV